MEMAWKRNGGQRLIIVYSRRGFVGEPFAARIMKQQIVWNGHMPPTCHGDFAPATGHLISQPRSRRVKGLAVTSVGRLGDSSEAVNRTKDANPRWRSLFVGWQVMF